MKKKIIHVLCEGQTEQEFVEEVLRPYLQDQGVAGVKSIHDKSDELQPKEILFDVGYFRMGFIDSRFE